MATQSPSRLAPAQRELVCVLGAKRLWRLRDLAARLGRSATAVHFQCWKLAARGVAELTPGGWRLTGRIVKCGEDAVAVHWPVEDAGRRFGAPQ